MAQQEPTFLDPAPTGWSRFSAPPLLPPVGPRPCSGFLPMGGIKWEEERGEGAKSKPVFHECIFLSRSTFRLLKCLESIEFCFVGGRSIPAGFWFLISCFVAWLCYAIWEELGLRRKLSLPSPKRCPARVPLRSPPPYVTSSGAPRQPIVPWGMADKWRPFFAQTRPPFLLRSVRREDSTII